MKCNELETFILRIGIASIIWIGVTLVYTTSDELLLQKGILEYNATTGKKQFIKEFQ